MRSTLSRNLVNEARLGYSGAPVTFFDELNDGHVHGDYQGGFALNFPTVGSALTGPAPPVPAAVPQREQPADRRHGELAEGLAQPSASAGRSRSSTSGRRTARCCRRISFGVLGERSGERDVHRRQLPRRFHGPAQRGARSVCVPDRPRDADRRRRPARRRAGKYIYMGAGLQEGRLREYGVFAQDSVAR